MKSGPSSTLILIEGYIQKHDGFMTGYKRYYGAFKNKTLFLFKNEESQAGAPLKQYDLGCGECLVNKSLKETSIELVLITYLGGKQAKAKKIHLKITEDGELDRWASVIAKAVGSKEGANSKTKKESEIEEKKSHIYDVF
jgi:hypothetical protein